MSRTTARLPRGFSLIELVIVAVIVAILGAIAYPRLSRGAGGAGEASLSASLRELRQAIDLYAAEHGGAFPTADRIHQQLLQYTDMHGTAYAEHAAAPAGVTLYGPYLRALPPLPVGSRSGSRLIGTAMDANVGWIYRPDTGAITAACLPEERDASGRLFRDY